MRALQLSLVGFFIVVAKKHHSDSPSPPNDFILRKESTNFTTNTSRVLFYSFFVAMEKGDTRKDTGYEIPFANKVCYMAKNNYSYLLDVIPKTQIPIRHGHLAPTWAKPPAIKKWLRRVDYLVYLDMDLVIKRDDIDFVSSFITAMPSYKAEPDLIVTDHNRALNNGAFILRNSAWGNKFAARWAKISGSKFRFPFSDNGSFIETLLSFLTGYGSGEGAGHDNRYRRLDNRASSYHRAKGRGEVPTAHPCMQPGITAGPYLDCANKYLTKALGKFTGEADRWLFASDGGVVRFVRPAIGFNSHEWNTKRTQQGWSKKACFDPHSGFVLHTKDWDTEVPRESIACHGAQLTVEPGEHVFGKWGRCKLSRRNTQRATRKDAVDAENSITFEWTSSSCKGRSPGKMGYPRKSLPQHLFATSKHKAADAFSLAQNATSSSISRERPIVGSGTKDGEVDPTYAPKKRKVSNRMQRMTAILETAFADGSPAEKAVLARIRPSLGTTKASPLKGLDSDVDVSLLDSEPLPPPGYPPPPLDDENSTHQSSLSIITNATKIHAMAPLPSAVYTETCTRLPPLSQVPTMRREVGSGDRFGAIAAPKTASTSLTKLMHDAGLMSSCGGVLWSFTTQSQPRTGRKHTTSQASMPARHLCPPRTKTPIKLMPYDFQYEVATGIHKGEAKEFKHLLHADYAEVQRHWAAVLKAFKGRPGTANGLALRPSHAPPRLFTAVVIRDPVSRLYSAYVHGKQMILRNQISPKDTEAMQNKESTRQRMDRWRRFYWSYRDYNDTILRAADKASKMGGFEAFAAIKQLPTHNQQTRMLAGVELEFGISVEILQLAQKNLCNIDCAGVLDDLRPLVRCLSKQLTGVLPKEDRHHNAGLNLDSTNSIKVHAARGGVTTTEGVSERARRAVLRISCKVHPFSE